MKRMHYNRNGFLKNITDKLSVCSSIFDVQHLFLVHTSEGKYWWVYRFFKLYIRCSLLLILQAVAETLPTRYVFLYTSPFLKWQHSIWFLCKTNFDKRAACVM
jgi:hypothetical protein